MHATPLSLTARTLGAELRELALALGATEHMGDIPGSVVRKTLKGVDYLYYQYRDLDGCTRQAYLGADNTATRALLERLATRAADRAEDLRRLDELRAAFVGAGAGVMEHAPLRVLQGFADAGVLQPGIGQAVLVGTHALALVNVPALERFALHKLLVSESREAAFAAKAEKTDPDAVRYLRELQA